MDLHKGPGRLFFIIGGVAIIGILGLVLNNQTTTPTLSAELTQTRIPETEGTAQELSNTAANLPTLTGQKLPAPPTTVTGVLIVNSTAPTFQPNASPTNTSQPPTPTIKPNASATNTPRTPTSIFQSSASPTKTPLPPTPDADCNKVGPLRDDTIPPGTVLDPGQPFEKSWSFYNIGSCTWDAGYYLSFDSGSLTYTHLSIPLDATIPTGMVGQVSVAAIAPTSPGTYEDSWILYDTNGQPLTDGDGEVQIFSISIVVRAYTPTPTRTPTPTQLPPANIYGRLIKDGNALGSGINLTLEDQQNQSIATAMTSGDGTFSWIGVPASTQGYNIVFSQVSNDQFGMGEVLTWVWVGPIPVKDGDKIQLGDIDIDPEGFVQSSPAPEAVYSAASITPDSPVLFQWSNYPNAIDYWVDLIRGEDELVWQSALVPAQSAAFDGTVQNGTHIQPDEYWWAVGARRWLGPYMQTVYTYLTNIRFEQ